LVFGLNQSDAFDALEYAHPPVAIGNVQSRYAAEDIASSRKNNDLDDEAWPQKRPWAERTAFLVLKTGRKAREQRWI
jgi:hypothetical protein